jgi:hypothetical protein
MNITRCSVFTSYHCTYICIGLCTWQHWCTLWVPSGWSFRMKHVDTIIEIIYGNCAFIWLVYENARWGTYKKMRGVEHTKKCTVWNIQKCTFRPRHRRKDDMEPELKEAEYEWESATYFCCAMSGFEHYNEYSFSTRAAVGLSWNILTCSRFLKHGVKL